MHAGEPDVTHVLLRSGRWTEKVLAKKRTMFICGDCVPHDPEVGIVGGCRERKTNGIVYPANRTHGVPQTYEMRLAFSGNVFLRSAATSKSIGCRLSIRMAYRE